MADRNLRILFITVLVEIIGFGILIPIVPLLFTDPSSQYFLLTRDYSIQTGYILLGLLIGIYPFAQFFATPILGQLSDTYGRKPVIEISVLGTVVSSALFGFGILVGSIPILFISRILNGLTGGLISVSQAAIADSTESSKRSKNFGILGAAFGVGFIIGPFLGGLLSSTSILPFLTASTPFFFAAGLSTVSFISVRMLLKETSPLKDQDLNWKQPIDNIYRALQIEGLQKLFTANFLYFTGFTFFTSFISVYLIQQFGFNQLQLGNFFFYIGVLVIIGQLVLVPRTFSRFKEIHVMPITLFLTGLFIALQVLPETLLIFLALIPFFSFSNALTQVSLTTLVSSSVEEKDQGLVLGVNTGLRALGQSIPAFLSGAVAAALNPSFTIVLAGVTLMATALGFLALRHRQS